MRSIKNNILIGLLLITPVVITLVIINFLFTFVTGYLVPHKWLATNYAPLFRAVALVIVFIALYFVGLFTRNFIGKKLYRFGDRILTGIPVIRSVYTAVRHISGALLQTGGTTFKQVVAIEFPRHGVYSLGFITAILPESFAANLYASKEPEEYLNIFVPTAPNPTSGFFLMVPRSSVIPLKIGVQEAMKIILSVGAITPGMHDSGQVTLLDRVEEWLKSRESKDEPDDSPGNK